MNDREFFVARRKAEPPTFQRVFAALPPDKLDYEPQEKSPTAAQIMWTIASEHGACADVVGRGRVDWAVTPPRSCDEMLLTTYIRPMGGKVPAIYGPSADSR